MSSRSIPLGLTLGLMLMPSPAAPQTAPGATNLAQDRQTGIEQLTTSTVVRRARQIELSTGQAATSATAEEPQSAVSRRTIGAPADISAAADSRGGVTMVVGGTDRCDPAATTATQESCRDVIENRANEFAHEAAPAISPESTLLAASQRAGITTNATGQAGLATTPDAEQRGNQEIATIVLNQQQQAASTGTATQPSLDANQQAIVNAVVQSITRGN